MPKAAPALAKVAPALAWVALALSQFAPALARVAVALAWVAPGLPRAAPFGRRVALVPGSAPPAGGGAARAGVGRAMVPARPRGRAPGSIAAATMPEAPHAPEHPRCGRSPEPRDFDGPGPSEAGLGAMLTIAARVPDHGRLAPWRFVVIRGGGRERLGAAIGRRLGAHHPDAIGDRKAMARRRPCFAPLVVAVVSCPVEHPGVPPWERERSAGAACANPIHAATAPGCAAPWPTGWYARDGRAFGEPGRRAGQRPAGCIHIGGAGGQRGDRQRPALSDVVRYS